MRENYSKKITSYRDLDVYQRAYKASIIVCLKIVPRLPREEKHDLSSQLRRSSKAVPRLIAEGYAKKHQRKGFQKYIDDAMAETNETVVSLSHVRDLYFKEIEQVSIEKMIKEYNIIGKQLYNLEKSWENFSKLNKKHY